MEASELRIGNYVLINNHWHKKKVCLIDSIGRAFTDGVLNCRHLCSVDERSSFLGMFPEGVYSGIRLTNNWLVNFGFIKNAIDASKINYWNKEKDVSIDVELTDNEQLFYYLVHNQERRKPLMYVHQLQNLYYALTGEELIYKP